VVVLTATEKLRAVPSVLVIATFWKEELCEPAVALNVAEPGLKTSNALLLTTSFTWIVSEALEPVGVTLMDPLYVPGVRPVVFTLTTILPGAVPFVGETFSHCPPVLVCAAAEKATCPLVLPIVTV